MSSFGFSAGFEGLSAGLDAVGSGLAESDGSGCAVVEGKIARSTRVRLVRDHVVVFEGRLSSLRRFKDDVREVAAGYECGVGLENYQDVKTGDVIEAYETEQIARRLQETGASAQA